MKVSNWKQQIERNVRDRGSIHYPVFQWGSIRFQGQREREIKLKEFYQQHRRQSRRWRNQRRCERDSYPQPYLLLLLLLSNFCSHSTCIVWRTSSFSSSVFTACYPRVIYVQKVSLKTRNFNQNGVGQACTTGSDLINPFHDIRIHYPIRSYRITLRMRE